MRWRDEGKLRPYSTFRGAPFELLVALFRFAIVEIMAGVNRVDEYLFHISGSFHIV